MLFFSVFRKFFGVFLGDFGF